MTPDGIGRPASAFRAGEEPGGRRVGRIDVAAKDDDRDATRAGQLKCGGGRLGAAAGNPGVVHDEYIRVGYRPGNPQPAGIHAPDVGDLRRDAQPDQGQVHARADDADKRMDARTALPARDHRGR